MIIIQVISSNITLQVNHGETIFIYTGDSHRIHNRSYTKTRLAPLTSKSQIPDYATRLSGLARPETRRTSETNQRAPPEHMMSAAVTSATRTPTIPHGNLTDTYHSVEYKY